MTAEIIHGDCLEVMRGMADGSVDSVVTDPPYGTQSLGGGYGRSHKKIANDSDLSILSAALPEITRVLRPDAFAMFFCAARMRHDVDALLVANGLPLFGEVIWDKGAPGLGYHIRYAHETAVVCRRGAPARPATPLLSVQRHTARRVSGHPHEKPVQLVGRIVQWASPEGGTVLDPFAGSGSTGVACIETGRSFIGIEREAAYVEIARQRIADAQAQLTMEVA